MRDPTEIPKWIRILQEIEEKIKKEKEDAQCKDQNEK